MVKSEIIQFQIIDISLPTLIGYVQNFVKSNHYIYINRIYISIYIIFKVGLIGQQSKGRKVVHFSGALKGREVDDWAARCLFLVADWT